MKYLEESDKREMVQAIEIGAGRDPTKRRTVCLGGSYPAKQVLETPQSSQREAGTNGGPRLLQATATDCPAGNLGQ